MARTYRRDSRGRFAGGGGGGGGGGGKGAATARKVATRPGQLQRAYKRAQGMPDRRTSLQRGTQEDYPLNRRGQAKRRQTSTTSARAAVFLREKMANSRGGKAASTRAANTARAAALRSGGTTGIGGRVRAKGFAGGKGAQQRAGGLRTGGTVSARVKGTGIGAGSRRGLRASAAAVGKARGKAASKGTRKMSKAPASAAKARYKQLSSAARKQSPFRTPAENRAAAGAKRSLKSMIAKRGRRR